jgi:hypothetical protein
MTTFQKNYQFHPAAFFVYEESRLSLVICHEHSLFVRPGSRESSLACGHHHNNGMGKL